MKSMTLKKLREEKDFLLYQEAVGRYVKLDLPLDYLKRGHAYGYFTSDGQLMGGVTLVTEGPLRALESIPSVHLREHLAGQAFMEVNGLWLSPTLSSKRDSSRFWRTLLCLMIKTMVLYRKRELCYAYSLNKKKLQKIYSLMGPRVLYKGEVVALPGNPGGEAESIECVSFLSLLFFPFKLLSLWKMALRGGVRKASWQHSRVEGKV